MPRRGRLLVSALLIRTRALKIFRLPGGSDSKRACKPFCKFFKTRGTRLTYVILYFGKASRTYSGRNVRRCTTVAPHVNGPKKPTMKSMAWFVGKMLR